MDVGETIVEELLERALAEGGSFVRWLDRNPQEIPPWQTAWIRGLALREAGRLRESLHDLTVAVELAQEASNLDVARIRSSRSLVHLSVGDADAALEDADWAAGHLSGTHAGRNENQRGVVLFRQGRHHEALEAYARAFQLLDDAGDSEAIDRLRRNRGVLHATLGDLSAARSDLESAAEGARRTNNAVALTITENNLGFVEGRAGDVPKALHHFARAEEAARGVFEPARLAISVVDRAEVLADAGLIDEALERVVVAIETLAEADEKTVLAEAYLLAARLYRLRGRLEDASRAAQEARVGFDALNRSGWSTKAAWIEMTVRHELGEPLDPIAARTLAHELGDLGWHLESQSLLLDATEAAVAIGDMTLASELVEQLRRPGSDTPAIRRVGHHRAVARTRFAQGDIGGARRAVTAGLKLLHEHRMSHGSAELRAHAGRHGEGLTKIALQLALEAGRPDDALVALDLSRDTEQPRWSRPPGDPELASDLAELRRLDAALRDAAREASPDREAEIARTAVETRVRDRLRVRAGAAETPGRLSVPELVRSLDGAHLRSWFVHEGRLGVITVKKSGRELELLGSVEELQGALDSWRFSVRRLAEGRGAERRLQDADGSARAAARHVATILGLDDHPEATPLVAVPTGVLRGVGWHSLPPLAGAPVSVVPSARHWLTARQVSPPTDRALVAAGPGLEAAEREVMKVAGAHAKAHTLTGDSATADAVSEGLDGAAVGHLAAHGEFRRDNPLFSALQFADGPLWIHDFERLEHPPHTLVLSSCDMALDRVVAGDAVVGMASGLLRLGVSSLIAPVLPVPDEETADFMILFHERMAAGATGSEALAATAAAFDEDTPRRQAVRQSFVAFGA